MIYITYDGETCMEVRGHAEFGKKGEDLLCAAVTGILYALKANCREGILRDGYARLSGGEKPIFEAFMKGFQDLESRFPKYLEAEYGIPTWEQDKEETAWKKK